MRSGSASGCGAQSGAGRFFVRVRTMTFLPSRALLMTSPAAQGFSDFQPSLEARQLSQACRELSEEETLAAARALCASLMAVAAEGN
jgi:hypothetical protein